MFGSASQFSAPAKDGTGVPSYVRAHSEVRAQFTRVGHATRLADCYETGGLRLKLPNADAICEGVLINTAGGMTGGDTARITAAAGAHTRLRITTQSAEKIYRAEDSAASVDVDLSLGTESRLAWMPQEMILFDGAALSRTLTVNMPECATAMLFEMTVFGRVARHEQLEHGAFRDRWRVRRGGKLVFAEDTHLDGNMSETLAHKAVGDGARAVATFLLVAPGAEARLNHARELLRSAGSYCGASAWNRMLVARFSTRNPHELRQDAAQFISMLMRTKPPRVWAC